MAKQQGVYQRCEAGCPARCKRHKWAFQVEFPPGPDGKRLRVRESGFPDAATAKDARDAAVKAYKLGTLETDRRKETTGAYLTRWLEAKETARTIRPATIKSYRGHLTNYLLPNIGRVRLTDLKAADIDGMLVRIRKANADKPPNQQVSASTERRIVATLRSAVRDALRTGQLHRDPTIGAHVAKEAGERRDVWTPEQFARFRSWMEVQAEGGTGNSHVERLAPLVLFAVGTGMRLGEVCGLRWSDVDLDAGHLTVRQQAQLQGREIRFQPVKTKAGQDRWVPVAGWVPDVLKAWKAQQGRERLVAGEAWSNGQGLVFTDALGFPLNPNNVSKTFGRMAERAGLPKVVFHSLRHLAATIMLQNGLPLPVVSRILGHSTITVTADLYFDVVKDKRLNDDVSAAYARAFSA
ncbi:site-specific integrase [Arthrobacter tumbae]|uniref:tyrosine-type recombinase/integrase n=1 Tax=Arthrobacter tumbae TaxID=163874 RepID=UPI00195A7129|nr:tyrosine-type recombinase/integrase [Arthrobacter tumbae]MBM7780465.1 integrase [Arthrobacter tumbae]